MNVKNKKVLLFYMDRYYLINQVPPFGLNLIANYLREHGHKVEIEYPYLPDTNYKNNIKNAINIIKPDVIGMGIRNIDTCMSCEEHGNFTKDNYRTFYFLPEIKKITSIIKETSPHTPIIVGGGAFTISPQAIMKFLGLNYGILGEGEQPFLQFLDAFPNKKKISQIPGIIFKSNNNYIINERKPYTFETDLTHYYREPKFNFSYKTNGLPIQVKRGCNQRCSYCVEPLIEKNQFIFRDIDDVINELKAVAKGQNEINNIFFIDTEFNLPNPDYCSNLVRSIIKEGLQENFHFVSQFIPKAFDLNFAQLLAKAGFSVVFSCESFSNNVLKKNYISYQEEDIITAIEACEKSGLHCTITLIFGLPGESYNTIEHTLNKMKDYPPGPLRSYEYTVGGRIYQGTPLCNYINNNNPSPYLYGEKSEGYLLPYYYCSPASPFTINKYIKRTFPDIFTYNNKYSKQNIYCLAIAYLSDQALWDKAIEKFMEGNVSIQTGIYDYIFKKLVADQKFEEAKKISLALLKKIKNIDSYVNLTGIIKFYLSCLG